MLLFILLSPASAMIKQKTYLGHNPLITNSTTFFQDQPIYMSYFEYITDDGYSTDLGIDSYYPISCTWKPYIILGGESGILTYRIENHYQNGTVFDIVNETNITFESGVNYLDNEENNGFSVIIPLSSQIYIYLERAEGNFTELVMNCWIKQEVTYKKVYTNANLDDIQSYVSEIVQFEIDVLNNVNTLFDFFILLWNYLIKWLILLEVLIWVFNRIFKMAGKAIDTYKGKKRRRR